ncbi:hypothetical protein [Nocardia sp. NPDC050717]|uniref:hypothetical protein n=1 Tax=Nocardia sp. NPDC050717 TaxID=3157221 RepID=UPI0033EC05E9
MSAVTIAVIVGFVAALLVIRALGRWNAGHAPMTVIDVLPVRSTAAAPRHAMMDR